MSGGWSSVDVANDEVERNEEMLWEFLISKLIMSLLIRKKSTDERENQLQYQCGHVKQIALKNTF